jgi:hypothetical protein
VPTPPAAEPGPAPRSIARSGVDDLAAAGGGHVDYGDNGMTTIDFTGGGTPSMPAFSTAPVTVSREVRDAPAAAPAAESDNVVSRAVTIDEVSTSVPQEATSPGAAAPAEADPDAIYEQVLGRLRRDLVEELEQNGHLLRETF